MKTIRVKGFLQLVTILALFTLTGGCGREPVFTPPISDGDPDDCLRVLHNFGEQFTAYKMSTERSPVQTGELSFGIINELNKFLVVQTQGTHFSVGREPLTLDEHNRTTSNISNAIADYLEKKYRISDQAHYKLLVNLYDDKFSRFDDKGSPYGVINIRLFLVNIQTKTILWHTDKAWGPGYKLDSAVETAATNIKTQLDNLFGTPK